MDHFSLAQLAPNSKKKPTAAASNSAASTPASQESPSQVAQTSVATKSSKGDSKASKQPPPDKASSVKQVWPLTQFSSDSFFVKTH